MALNNSLSIKFKVFTPLVISKNPFINIFWIGDKSIYVVINPDIIKKKQVLPNIIDNNFREDIIELDKIYLL